MQGHRQGNPSFIIIMITLKELNILTELSVLVKVLYHGVAIICLYSARSRPYVSKFWSNNIIILFETLKHHMTNCNAHTTFGTHFERVRARNAASNRSRVNPTWHLLQSSLLCSCRHEMMSGSLFDNQKRQHKFLAK